jgi:Anti-sigma-K factor rskA, C-terminal
MNHDEIRASLEAYSLGALDEPELSEVGDHVAACETCRDELERYEQVATSLARALAAAAPVAPSEVAAQRIRRAIRWRAARSRLATIVAAVAAVLLVVAAGWIWRSERTRADERERSERLITEQEIIFEVVDAPERQRIVLRPASGEADWYGKVFTRPDLPFVVVMAGRLPEAADGSTYHVWLTLDDGATVLAGRLEPNDRGFAPLVYTAENDGPVVTDALVTAERDGATQPSGPAVLVSQTS